MHIDSSLAFSKSGFGRARVTRKKWNVNIKRSWEVVRTGSATGRRLVADTLYASPRPGLRLGPRLDSLMEIGLYDSISTVIYSIPSVYLFHPMWHTHFITPGRWSRMHFISFFQPKIRHRPFHFGYYQWQTPHAWRCSDVSVILVYYTNVRTFHLSLLFVRKYATHCVWH